MQRFARASYRTTRLILLSKGLLNPGEALQEAVGDVLTQSKALRPEGSLAAIAAEAGSLPTIPTEDLTEEEIKNVASVHIYAAIQIGYEPNDECLHWLRPGLIEEFFPKADGLIAFESSLLERAGKRLIEKGRSSALRYLKTTLGDPNPIERKDWSALPMAYVRTFLESTTEDDRTLIVARLELLAVRARESMDTKTELAAVKAIAQIKGLLFNDADGRNMRALAMLFGQATPRDLGLAVVRNTPHSRALLVKNDE